MHQTNPELELVHDYVQQTGSNIFLTGKAGTGKTTFLKSLQEQTAKRFIVTAPTGVAAMNAGGVTLHSFFQLPFGPFVPGSEASEQQRQHQFRFSKEKKKIIASLDLLVIDEISMVRADMLDAVDNVLRRLRRSDQPFGGVQLLLIGDLHQLAPVAKKSDWQILQSHYDSVYFFSSKALEETELVTIELKHIYRQSDDNFIELLNRVRDNQLDQDSISALNGRYIERFSPAEGDSFITLATHNKSAELINDSRLRALASTSEFFNAQVQDDFPEYNFPTPLTLELKMGAQVMFVRNDVQIPRRFYNGKIGRIVELTDELIKVRCPGDDKDIVVEKVRWDNIKYSFDEESREISEEVIGSFEQYPLMLAWAITIHKSQGLTFDKAIIDAQDAFAHGQVYVALSRCRSLEGLVLSSPLSTRGIARDQAVSGFVARAKRPSRQMMEQARIEYQQQLILSCFDLGKLQGNLAYLFRLLRGNKSLFKISSAVDLDEIQQQADEMLFVVSEKFRRQLGGIFASNNLPETDGLIGERIAKGSHWFKEKWEILADLVDLQVETDNKELAKKIDRALGSLLLESNVKLAGITSCEKGFSPTRYLRAISAAEVDSPKSKPKKKKDSQYSETDMSHSELFQSLRQWRSAKAVELGVPPFHILHQKVLIQIAVQLPESLGVLGEVHGVGPKTVENFGDELVGLVNEYRDKHGLEIVVLPEPSAIEDSSSKKKKEQSKRGTTREITLELFEQGKDVSEIATQRELATSTIESHLCFWLEEGRVAIDKLLSAEKQQAIGVQLDRAEDKALGPIKHALGDDFSYGEILMVIAHRKRLGRD